MRISRERAPAAHALAAAPAAGEGGKTLAAFLSVLLLPLPIQPTALLCERLRDLAQEDRQQEVHATYDEYH